MIDRDWLDDHGYQRIHCSACGWSGWTDSGCEGCPDDDEEDPIPDEEREIEDAEVETFSRFTVHVARIAHRNGYIQPGDTYRRTVYGGYIGPCRDYPEGGPRWLRVVKTLVKRAEEAA
jgi:hypothetical protein